MSVGKITIALLIACLTAGQLVKLPLAFQSGITLLDLVIVFLTVYSLVYLKFKLVKPSKPLIFALIFIAVMVLSLIFTPLKLSVPEYLQSFAYTLRFSVYLLFGWTLYSGALSKLKDNGSKILSLAGIFLAVLGLIQLAIFPDLKFLESQGWDPHFFRTVSTFLDPNFLGTYLALTILLLIIFPITRHPRFNLAAFVLVYLAFITTFSRGAALVLFSALFIAAYLEKSRKLLFMGLILTGGFVLAYLPYYYLVALPHRIDRLKSAEYRLGSYQAGLKMFQKSPVFGVGFNSYRYALREYRLIPEPYLKNHGSSSNDSSLLFVLATTGLAGFIPYLLTLFSLGLASFYAGLAGNRHGVVLLSILGGLIIQSFLINVLFYPWILISLILIVVNLSHPKRSP